MVIAYKYIRIFQALLFIFLFSNLQSQTASIGTEQLDNDAVLWLFSPNGKQGLIIPIVTTRTGIGKKGMVVFDGSDNKMYYHDGSNWLPVGNSSTITMGGDISGSSSSSLISKLQGKVLTANAEHFILCDGNGE